MNQWHPMLIKPKPATLPGSRAKLGRFWGSFKGIWTQRQPGARFERQRLMRVENRFLAHDRL